MSTKASQRRLAKLHKRNPQCHWCPRITTLMLGVNTKATVRQRATLDHLDDRFSPMRGRHPRGIERTVLACWDCNHKRGQRRQAALVALQRRKSLAGHIHKAIRQTLAVQPAVAP